MAVDPDALEELGEQLAAGFWVGFGLPEGGEVLQDGAGGVEVWRWAGCEAVQFGVDRVAFADVGGLVEVAEFVEVAQSFAPVFELALAARGVLVAGLFAGEAVEDLVAHGIAGLEGGDERGDLVLDLVGVGERLVARVPLGAVGAVVARLLLLPARLAVHPAAAALAAHDAAQEVVR